MDTLLAADKIVQFLLWSMTNDHCDDDDDADGWWLQGSGARYSVFAICYTSQHRRASLINPSTRNRWTLDKLCHCAKEGAVIRGNVNSLLAGWSGEQQPSPARAPGSARPTYYYCQVLRCTIYWNTFHFNWPRISEWTLLLLLSNGVNEV